MGISYTYEDSICTKFEVLKQSILDLQAQMGNTDDYQFRFIIQHYRL